MFPEPQFSLKTNNEHERTTCDETNHKLPRHVSRIEPRLYTDNFGCQVKKKQKNEKLTARKCLLIFARKMFIFAKFSWKNRERGQKH
jgi:hypothetical protein